MVLKNTKITKNKTMIQLSKGDIPVFCKILTFTVTT